MEIQFKAGYIADAIAKIINDYRSNLYNHKLDDKANLDKINGLLQLTSSFDVDFPHKHEPDFKNLNPVLATLNNIITRGLPTRAPLILEELFVKIGLTKRNEDKYELNFPILADQIVISYEDIFNLLHIIEPQLEINRENYGGKLGSNLEWEFIKSHPFLKQILQSQRDFSTINKKMQGGKTVDFCFTYPYLCYDDKKSRYENKGIIFEVDGPHHSFSIYEYYDAYRDIETKKEGFETMRYKVEDIKEKRNNFEKLFEREIYQIFKTNFEKNEEDIKKQLALYSLLFIPLAVARIQKTILEFLLINPTLFDKERVEIAIVERDIPCGAIAIESLKQLFLHINSILEDNQQLKLPEITLIIFQNKKWVIDERMHLQASVEDEQFFNEKEGDFDIVIDHSILRRSNIYKEADFKSDKVIKIRSAHFFDTAFGTARRVYCAHLLHYKELVEKQDNGSYKAIEQYEAHIAFFIQNVFRKVDFREGQLPIISRALQRKPVIGLLPTGGGKSLTFQLVVLLQPGLCLVVDLIKSLMEDQVRVLKENWMDCCEYINSNLDRKERYKRLIDFLYGETLFLYISPERFVMEEFRRDILEKINKTDFGLAFSYCVIDEVHCLSEWGHDFRTTYLMLGKNAQKFAPTKSGEPVSLIGLTATASFDVLADVERELSIKHDDIANAIIMIENTIRPELFFRVIDVTYKERITVLNDDFSKIGSNMQKLNNKELIEKSKKHHHDNFNDKEQFNENILFVKAELNEVDDFKNKTQNDFCAIVFCQVKKSYKKKYNGVDDVFSNLNSNSKGFYYSNDTDDKDNKGEETEKHFNDFIYGRTKHMVCTKAFGMGIDKKDIRSTYHYFYPVSLESLVQEAGRSGRDKKISEANILVSTRKHIKVDVCKLFSENKTNDYIKLYKYTRKAIRDIKFSSFDEVEKCIELIDFSLINKNGKKYNNLPPDCITSLRNILKEKDSSNNYKFLIEEYEDRETPDYFHKQSFKGIDVERSQFLNLFKVKEFHYVEQDTLENIFYSCDGKSFCFFITDEKQYSVESICKDLGVDPQLTKFQKTNSKIVEDARKYSKDFNDFLFRLVEEGIINKLPNVNEDISEKLFSFYSGRKENDIGKLIYRMHSMGFLEDYLIDYNKNKLHICTFNKFKNIDEYTTRVEKYLRRYLSEKTTEDYMSNLKERLNKPKIIDNILECLYFLSEFSYKETVSKKKRVTDEIEGMLNTSITEKKYVEDWYEQNIYIKEQIYFYFNAKYARMDFKINGESYSLLDDYNNSNKNKQEILYKYLEVYQLEGTEQNNYKHMIGSCKKISLEKVVSADEWLLRLLKAFAMYSVNNNSYIVEANEELYEGFNNLYKELNKDSNKLETIKPIFDKYFDRLLKNINPDNDSFNDIKMIRLNLLFKMQTEGIKEVVDKIKI